MTTPFSRVDLAGGLRGRHLSLLPCRSRFEASMWWVINAQFWWAREATLSMITGDVPILTWVLCPGYLSARWTFPLPLNYPLYNALSERPPIVKILLLPELAIQKPTLLQAGEEFWLQELRDTDILTQTLSPPGLENKISSCGLSTCLI